MQIKELFIAQLEREAAITRRLLERLPEGLEAWKPHEKSMAFGYLATLVATMPGWIESMVNQPELDVAPKDGGGYSRPSFKSASDRVQGLDDSVSKARRVLEATTDAHLMSTWRLLAGGRTVAEHPRHEVICDTFSHWAHHRGQLSVYLRLNDVPLPSIYGPTADERVF